MEDVALLGSPRFRRPITIVGVALLLFAVWHFGHAWIANAENVEYYRLFMAGRIKDFDGHIPYRTFLVDAKLALDRARFESLFLGIVGGSLIGLGQYSQQVFRRRQIK